MRWSLLKLLPRLSQPQPFTVFGLLLVAYCLVVSGVVYDLIHKPPSMGTIPVREGSSAFLFRWRQARP